MYKKALGLTLLELIVGLAIISILALLALNLGSSFVNRNHAQLVANEINNAVRYARNMALIYNKPVVLAPPAYTNDWSRGMILFLDNQQHRHIKDVQLLHQWQWAFTDVQVKWQGFHTSQYLLFNPQLKAAATNGHFSIVVPDLTIKLVVNRFGRIESG